ncbi:MAG: extracellular solute-binding protein [Oscillospiraceae bacterium]|nr:extracellular solute-binding protein [Oscillospiraceae bacterium]
MAVPRLKAATVAAQTSGDSSSEGVTLHILGPETSNPYIHFADRENYSTWQAFKKLFEERGINPEFEIVASDQYKTTIQTRMASGSNLPDFAQVSSLDDSSIMNYVNMGQFLSVTQLMEEGDGTAKAFFETGKGKLSNTLNTTEDGNAYWISQIQATTYAGNPGSTSMVINIRQDWLDQIGQSLPTTAEEFYQALKAMQDQDVNGNGQKDEVLAFNPASFQNGIAQWFGLVTDITSFVIEDAEVTSPWYQDGIKDYFKFLNKLASENLLDTSLIGLTTDDQLDQRIAENKASAIFTYAMQTWYEPSVAAEGASYQPLAPLQAAEGITPVNAIEPPNLSYGKWVFTKAVTDQKAAAALLDLLCSEDYQTLTQWGIEGETYEVVDGENQLLDIALNASWEQAASEGKAIGDALWANGSMFPKRRFVPMENEISVVPENKAEFQKEIISYSPTVPLGNENYLPVMTSEQVETRLGIITDLKTRSEELATQLILGQASLDNWDTYIEELKALGLDQLIEIDQSRLDRYMASLG